MTSAMFELFTMVFSCVDGNCEALAPHDLQYRVLTPKKLTEIIRRFAVNIWGLKQGV